MIIDDVIWEIINNGHCSYKTKTVTNTFCRNPYNLTGLCNRNSCPLANSRYATVIEEKGMCYLYMKTTERAHTPKEMWEKIKLDKSYNKALEQIDENLLYWPEFLKHKSKQRFTRIRQILIKRKKMKLEGNEQYEVVSRKAEKREKSRLVKAEKSAVIDKHIEEELLKNYQSGKYSHIYNYPQKNFENILNKEEIEEKEEDYNSEDLDNIYIEDIADDNEDEEDDYTDEDNEDDDEYEEDEDDVIDNIFGGKDVNKTTSTSARSKGKFVNKKRNRPTKLEYEKEYENKDKNILHDIDF